MKAADTSEHLTHPDDGDSQLDDHEGVKGKGHFSTLADIHKCFERVHLANAHQFLLLHLADTKTAKVLSLFLSLALELFQGFLYSCKFLL